MIAAAESAAAAGDSAAATAKTTAVATLNAFEKILLRERKLLVM